MLNLNFSSSFGSTNPFFWRALIGFLLIASITGSVPTQGALHSPSEPAALLSWEQINTDGFGYPSFNTAWSLTTFQNQLYAGTRRTLGAWIFKRLGDTTSWVDQSPAGWSNSNTAVPAMVVDEDQFMAIGTENMGGSQVWEYVNSAWISLNTNGFDGTGRNTAVWSMAERNGIIYAGTRNINDGNGLFYYTSGGWTQIGLYGFGDIHNEVVTSMAWLGFNYLYVGTWNSYSGAEIWRYDGYSFGWIKKGGFGDSNNWAARSMAVFNNQLYVGTYNPNGGAQVWRYNEIADTWTKVAMGGFNNSANQGVSSLYPFDGYLYAGTENMTSGAQIWRTSNGSVWEPVMTGGFSNPNNNEIPSLVGSGHWLVAGTRNYATGGEVWRSSPLGEIQTFQVSNYAQDAFHPDVAANLNTGEYLVTWEDRDTFYSALGISARRFSSEGNIDGAIAISTGADANPQVAFDSDLGHYLVVWNAGGLIKAQLLNADGSKIGGQTTLRGSGEVTELEFSPVTDDFILLYTLYSNPPHPFSAGLNVMTVTPGGIADVDNIVVRVLDTNSEIFGAGLAWNHAHNECLAVWSEETSHGIFVEGRIIELVTPDVLESAFTIDASSDFDYKYPSVAAMGSEPAGTGTYLVVWEYQFPYTNTVDPDYIAGRKVNGNGVMVGERFRISESSADHRCPKTAANESARTFLAAYSAYYENFPETFASFIFGKFLSGTATSISEEHWMGGGSYLSGGCPSVVGGVDNEFMVVDSHRAPSAVYNQIWATRTSYHAIFLPFIRR